MLAICEWCQAEDDHEAVSSRRGPDNTWVRLKCVKCKEEWEEYVGIEGHEEIDDG